MAEPAQRTMKALIHNQAENTLRLSDSVPIPTPGEHEHLLKVESAAITTGELSWPRPPELNELSPAVEMAGTVVTPPAGSKFRPGDKIYLRTTYPRAGSAREYSIGLEQELALRPKDISANEAAAVPVSALTAWQMLFVQAGLRPDFESSNGIETGKRPRIFVNGLTGGVGLWTAQLAYASGYEVVGTCSAANAQLARQMGASEVINYRETSISDWLKAHPDSRFDYVFDMVTDGSTAEVWHAARDHGTVLTIVPPKNMQWKWDLDRPEGVNETVNGKFFIMESNGDQLQKITGLIEAGKVRPVVDSVFMLSEYEKAFERVSSGRAVGKVVLQILAA